MHNFLKSWLQKCFSELNLGYDNISIEGIDNQFAKNCLFQMNQKKIELWNTLSECLWKISLSF